jgi:hypothetical protein
MHTTFSLLFQTVHKIKDLTLSTIDRVLDVGGLSRDWISLAFIPITSLNLKSVCGAIGKRVRTTLQDTLCVYNEHHARWSKVYRTCLAKTETKRIILDIYWFSCTTKWCSCTAYHQAESRLSSVAGH